MILGIGADLCDIRRIERTIERFGERFLARVFTDEERARAEAGKTPAATYAKRFAAKEACAKALGGGIGDGAAWRDMGVENLDGGRPTLVLTGQARATLARLTPAGCDPVIHLTLTDEHPMAQAFVVISAIPRPGACPSVGEA